jgi:predicted Fe-Mo cluster-binding NifX family protein
MRVAIAAHEGRVSPVLDVARRLLVVEKDGEAERSRQDVPLTSTALVARVRDIQAAGVAVLICGAVSRPLAAALHAAGIQVVAQVCGPTEEVLAAFFADQLDRDDFRMPGCCRRRGRYRHGRGGGPHRTDVGACDG